jgi:hypothetical protein
MYRRDDDEGLLDLIFELAGGVGGGRAGHLRVWSAIVLVLMGMLALAGGYVLLGSRPMTLAAAKIEGGFRPRLHYWTRRGHEERESYAVAGRLGDLDSVVFDNGGASWRCAPLSSGRADAESHPHVFYAASEARYRRAHAENLFEGEIYAFSEAYVPTAEAGACRASADAFLIIDDGSLRSWRESGRSLLIIGGVVGAIALAAFLTSLRRQRDVPAPPAPLPE